MAQFTFGVIKSLKSLTFFCVVFSEWRIQRAKTVKFTRISKDHIGTNLKNAKITHFQNCAGFMHGMERVN